MSSVLVGAGDRALCMEQFADWCKCQGFMQNALCCLPAALRRKQWQIYIFTVSVWPRHQVKVVLIIMPLISPLIITAAVCLFRADWDYLSSPDLACVHDDKGACGDQVPASEPPALVRSLEHLKSVRATLLQPQNLFSKAQR